MYKVYQKSVRQTESFKDLQRLKDETSKIDKDEMSLHIKPTGTTYIHTYILLLFLISTCWCSQGRSSDHFCWPSMILIRKFRPPSLF